MLKYAIYGASETETGELIYCSCSSAVDSWSSCLLHKAGKIVVCMRGTEGELLVNSIPFSLSVAKIMPLSNPELTQGDK